MSIGERLREWRKSQNLTTTDIHNETYVSLGALSNYETDKREINSGFLLKLKEVYNADIYYILTGVKNGKDLRKVEIELIHNFRILPQEEQYKYLGRIEADADRYKQETKLSTLKSG